MKKISLIFSIIGLMFIASCGGGNDKKERSYNEDEYTDVTETEDESFASNDDNGIMEESNSTEESSTDWNPVGTYSMEDADGNEFQLTVKKGGSAELYNKAYEGRDDYKPTKGSWTKGSDGKSINLDFFSGPFIHIASHDYVTDPVLTSEFFYYDGNSYRDDTDCLEVKKID